MINTASGSKLAIGPAGQPANLTAYQAIAANAFTDVGEIEDLGEFGDESESVGFTSLSKGRVQKLKGPRDAGSMALVVGDDMTDEGQIALEAAEGSPLDFVFRVELNDAITIGGDNSVHYFYGKVMSKRRNAGNASNVVRRTFSIGVNSEILATDPS